MMPTRGQNEGLNEEERTNAGRNLTQTTERPASNLFDAGHRIRITVTGAGTGNFETEQVEPPPTVTIYRNADHASYIELPIIPAGGRG